MTTEREQVLKIGVPGRSDVVVAELENAARIFGLSLEDVAVLVIGRLQRGTIDAARRSKY